MSEKLTEAERKELAVKYLEKIKCYKPYLKAYRDKGIVTMYEGFGGYYVEEHSEPELFKKIKEVESKFGGTVYAVIHNFFEFGECYTMLWVSQYKEDQEYAVDEWNENMSGVFAWVWNKTVEDFSEFGTVGIQSALGGLLRIS